MKYWNKQKLIEEFDQVYFDLNQIPEDIRNFYYRHEKYSAHNFLHKGDLTEYLIEPFKNLQPKTYQQLMQGNFFYALEKTDMGYIIQLGILINDRAFYMQYSPYGYAEDPTHFTFQGMPDFILQSWLYRSNQWNIAQFTIPNVFVSTLPSDLTNTIHSLIPRFKWKKNIDRYSDFLDEKFHYEFRRNYTDKKYNENMDDYFQLFNLLDTGGSHIKDRPNANRFQIYFLDHHLPTNGKQKMFVIKNHDVFGIKELSNPQDAIDSYAEHLFIGDPNVEFDFDPYLIDF